MSDQDDLRDKIAEAIYALGADDLNTVPLPAIAQAVIDELGLTMETNAAVEGPRHMRRIISEWEWE